jgi:WhiB family redox-sensing transcriptional regulator
VAADRTTLTLLDGVTTPPVSDQKPFAIRRRIRHSARRVGTSREPQPIDIDTSHLAWQANAICTSCDPEMFFVEGAVSNYLRRLCLSCPVQADCLLHALADPTLVGVWAGTTAEERRRLRRRDAKQATAPVRTTQAS